MKAMNLKIEDKSTLRVLSEHLTDVAEFFFILYTNDFVVNPRIRDGFYARFDKMASRNKKIVDAIDKLAYIMPSNADHRKQRGRTAPNGRRHKK